LLPNATADQVRRETERLLQGMTADGGGYILSATHTVPPETPDQNIFAMYQAAGITREEIMDSAAAIRARIARRKLAGLRPSPFALVDFPKGNRLMLAESSLPGGKT